MGVQSSCFPCGCLVAGSASSARRSPLIRNGRSSWTRALSSSFRPLASLRPEAASGVEEKDGGFGLEVRAVGGETWNVTGNSGGHTVGGLKARLALLDNRFSTHRADLVLGSVVLDDAKTLKRYGISADSRLLCVFSDLRAAVLVIGGGVAGYRALEDLRDRIPDQQVVLVDAQEYFENASGLLRAYADPAMWEKTVFRHEDAVRNFHNAHFVQGEVVSLRPGSATVVTFRDGDRCVIKFNYCIVATGCTVAPRSVSGETLWRPSSLAAARRETRWPSVDERTVDGRRTHIQQVHTNLKDLSDRHGSVLVVGADYQGVEWACMLKHFFPGIRIAIMDSVNRCLCSLPLGAASYADASMRTKGIATYYKQSYEPEKSSFWRKVGLTGPADVTFVFDGKAAQNSFMPPSTVSSGGPGDGGWIVTNSRLQVCFREAGDQPGQVWASGNIFAVGDCRYSAVVDPKVHKKCPPENIMYSFTIPPVPKTAFAAIYWAEVACRNIGCIVGGWPLEEAGWPVSAGTISVSLGPRDGLVACNITWQRDSGEVVLTGEDAAAQKRWLGCPDDQSLLYAPSQWLDVFSEALPSCHRISKAAVVRRQ